MIGTVPEPGASLAPGTWLGRHQLLHRLAVGGMAEIYLARATGIEQFEKLLVLKRMLPQYAADHRFIRMFLDEARLAATLTHPNIAHVYDIGCGDGQYYFTMEHIHGEDLAAVLHACRTAGRPVPLAHALTVVTGVAAGLHAAHEKRGADGALLGVVHRDVTPSNILVGYDGSVKVVDFGIAKVAAQHGTTRTGGFMGKARYASPEHVRGEQLDRRSDLFSLGILLYELTTGTRPFDGDSDFAVMQSIVSSAPRSPACGRAEYPAALSDIVMRALARDREARFATAQDMQLALEALARQAQVSLSSVMLAGYMAELFGDKLAAWHEARRAGRSLTDHVIATITGGTVDLTPAIAMPRAELAVEIAAPRSGMSRGRRRALGAGLLGAALGIAYAVSSGFAGDRSPPAHEPAASASAPGVASAIIETTRPAAPSDSVVSPESPELRDQAAHVPAATPPTRSPQLRSPRPRVHRAPPVLDGAARRAQPATARRGDENPRSWDPDSPLEP